MHQELTTLVRSQLDMFKQIMVTQKDKAICPTALLIQPNGEQFMIVMEWRSEEEKEIVLAKLCGAVYTARALAVVLTMAVNVLMTKTNQAEAVLLSTLYVPSQKPFSIGYKFAMVEQEPVFGEEISSADIIISPFPVPDLWPGWKDSGTIH
jgi:hypothetical protein